MDKPKLNDRQKWAIKHWVHPSASTSAQCSKCGRMFSLGFLVLCTKDPDWFCEKKYGFYGQPAPRGFTDEELMRQFGITREDLNDDSN